MDLAEMKRKGLISSIPIDKVQINELLSISDRDLELAEEITKKNFDVGLSLSYNAMLQAARAFMFSHGYRPDSEFHHKATIEFIGAVLNQKNISYVESLDRIRSKRVTATYERSGAISEYEAKHALESARRFVVFIKEQIKKRIG